MKIGLIAAEASGDKLGALLIAELRRQQPKAEIIGVGGDLMRAAGCELIGSIDELSVMGISEVLRQYPRLRKLQQKTIDTLLASQLDICIGIDAPDYNLAIEQRLKDAGVFTVHFISPTVWAWRPKRVHSVARACHLLLSIYPFEKDYYRDTNLRVEYIGHPLADAIDLAPDQATARAQLGFSDGQKLIALLPGSRASEIAHHAKLFAESARLIQRQQPDCHFLLVAANDQRAQQLRALIPEFINDTATCSLLLGNAQSALQAADYGLLVSGTASLEALLSKLPMVVAYKTSWLSYHVLRLLVKSRYVAQPNWLAGKMLVPEFLQSAATSANLSSALLELMQQPDHSQLQQQYLHIHQSLRQGASTRAASTILAMAENAAKS